MSPAAPPPRPGGFKGVVIGFAAHYSAGSVAPFLLSLRASGFAGDVILGVLKRDLADPAWRSLAAATRTELRSLAMGGSVAAHVSALGLGRARSHAKLARYQLAHAWALDMPDATAVLLTDVRDVVFQRDPFVGFDVAATLLPGQRAESDPAVRDIDGRVLLFAERPDRAINDCPFNSEWIRHCWGGVVLAEVGRRTIVCSGVVVGMRRAMLAYTKEMARLFEEHPVCAVEAKGYPHDQAYVNYGLWHNYDDVRGELGGSEGPPRLAPTAALVPLGTGLVATVGSLDPDQLRRQLDARGLVRNDDGSVVAVVHQWDRHAAVLAAVVARLTGLPLTPLLACVSDGKAPECAHLV